MSTAERVTLVYLDEPCPMCGSEWGASGVCHDCGETLDDAFPEDMLPSEPSETESTAKPLPMMQHRVIGVLIWVMCGMVWHFLSIGTKTSNDSVWNFMRVVGLMAIGYGFLIGTYAVITGRAPKHHRWE